MTGDVVDLIMQDHREVERLFDELKQHRDKRPLPTPVLASVLTAHSRAEESEEYDRLLAELTEAVLHHVQEEESTELPQMRETPASPAPPP